MAMRQTPPDERYDVNRHGGLDHWQKDNPKLKGYYTVICNIRNHLWVKYRYWWNGAYWVTPGNNITKSVVMYLHNSWAGE